MHKETYLLGKLISASVALFELVRAWPEPGLNCHEDNCCCWWLRCGWLLLYRLALAGILLLKLGGSEASGTIPGRLNHKSGGGPEWGMTLPLNQLTARLVGSSISLDNVSPNEVEGSEERVEKKKRQESTLARIIIRWTIMSVFQWRNAPSNGESTWRDRHKHILPSQIRKHLWTTVTHSGQWLRQCPLETSDSRTYEALASKMCESLLRH